jgi:hypothetical protein
MASVEGNSLGDRPVLAATDRRLRSRVTNGRSLFVEPDQRGPWSRRFRDVYGEIISDLGGADILSEAQRQLARRCATIAIACERLEGQCAAGQEVDMMIYGMLTDRLGRTFQRLGTERRPREVLESLSQYLARNCDADDEESAP